MGGRTINREFIQFDEEQPLILEQPGVTAFVHFGAQEDPAGSALVPPARVINGDVVGEWFVVQVGESDEDVAAGLEVHSAGEIHVGLLPECVHGVGGGPLGLDGDAGDPDAGVIQLE